IKRVFDYQKLIKRYVPTIYDLLSIESFLVGGTQTISNPLLSELDANGTDAFGPLVLQQVTDIYGNGVDTPKTVKQKTGPDFSVNRGFSIFPFDAWLPRLPGPDEIWYQEVPSTAGDGTVPLSSSYEPFTSDEDKAYFTLD